MAQAYRDVVVGSGSAGAALAERLNEGSSRSVLLRKASPIRPEPTTSRTTCATTARCPCERTTGRSGPRSATVAELPSRAGKHPANRPPWGHHRPAGCPWEFRGMSRRRNSITTLSPDPAVSTQIGGRPHLRRRGDSRKARTGARAGGHARPPDALGGHPCGGRHGLQRRMPTEEVRSHRVILAADAVNSPPMLLRSGFVSADDLKAPGHLPR